MNKIMQAKVYASKANMTQEAWLESRRHGIGGSDAAGIMGLHPYKSAYQVYLDKIGELPEQPDNEQMRQGRDFEEYVAKRFTEDTGKKVRNCNYILQHPKYPFMLANVDRLIVGENAGLECKTTSVLNLRRFKGGVYPEEYYVQCVHYLAVTGADRWYLGVLILNKGYTTYTIEREEALEDMEKLIASEQAFWEHNVLAGVEPVPDGSARTGEAIQGQYPEADDGADIDLSLYDAEIERYMTLNGEIKAREREQDAIKQRIQLYMKDAAKGHASGYRVSWSNTHSARLDSKALKAGNPDVYAQYLKDTTTRTFRVTAVQ